MTAVRSMMVNVGANVGPYVAGMNTAGASTARFGTQAAAASGAARGLGATAVGSAAKFLGPAGLVIGLSRSMSASRDFESSTIDLRTQIGLTADESNTLAAAARQVGTDYGVGAQSAVDASWQIASAGLRGTEATEALEAAARAAAVGFGEMDTIAGLSAAAVNAYGSEVLGASEATDILAAAVREGTAAPEELASSLGRALPVASAMSVSFDELSAAVAGMTRTGTSAPEAVTQIRSMLIGILSPAENAAEAMAEVGLSSQGLQQTIQEEGLLAAMQQLAEATGMNSEQLSAIFPNIRAFQGFLDLMGPNAAENAAIFERMADSVGMVGEAFEEVERSSTQFQIDRLKANISDLALETMGLNQITREYLRSLNEVMEVGIVRSTFTPPDFARHGREGGLFGPGGFAREWFTGDVFGQTSTPDNQNQAGHIAAMRAQADQYVGGLQAMGAASRDASGGVDRLSGAMRDNAGRTEEAAQAVEDYLDAVRAATDPVFALERALSDVDDAQQAYNDAVAEFGAQSDEAEQAAWGLFGALLDLEAAALDGDLSFAEFEAQLNRFVGEGRITAEQAAIIRARVLELTEAAEGFEGNYRATIVVDDRDAHQRINGVATAIRTLNGSTATVRIQGSVSSAVGSALHSAIRTGQNVGMATGGPVWPGRTALVGEHGPELVTFAGHGRVIPANQTAQIMRGGDGASQTTLNVYGNPDPRTVFRARDMWEAV